jgi:23S rRNA (uracil-5-)-methyltransferase RumA
LDRDSGLFDEEFEEKLRAIRQWCVDTGLPAWHPPAHHGFYRYLVVRKSFTTDELLVNLVTSEMGLDDFNSQAFVACLQEQMGKRLAGVIHTINPNTGDRIDPLSGKTNLLWGSPVIMETIHGLKFEISMTSFFQTNPRSAEKLYSKVLEYAGVHETDDGSVILDLFCGTGTISQLLAKQSSRNVIGVDIVDAAIHDARRNAERNDVQNLEFFAADVGKFLLEYPQYQGRINCAVLDPPRGGIAPKTLRKIIALGAKRIVYVSCNPSTQARDTIDLLAAGYTLHRISLVDQFPHTSHVETVAWFELE